MEARERELAAQRAQREAERQALRRLQKTFAVRVEGSATINKAPKVGLQPKSFITDISIYILQMQAYDPVAVLLHA